MVGKHSSNILLYVWIASMYDWSLRIHNYLTLFKGLLFCFYVRAPFSFLVAPGFLRLRPTVEFEELSIAHPLSFIWRYNLNEVHMYMTAHKTSADDG